MEDQGEATFLIGNRTDPLSDLPRFLYANLRCQIHYRPELNAELFQYRTRSGVKVPICFGFAAGELGVLPILEDYPGPQAGGAAQSFLKTYPKSKIIYANAGKNFVHLSPRSSVIAALVFVNSYTPVGFYLLNRTSYLVKSSPCQAVLDFGVITTLPL
jgi:hypothetical protein